MRLSVHAQRLAPLLVGVLLVGGCAAEAEPEPIFAEPEPSSSPTPTAAPAVERETVKQFLQRWSDEERDMQNTGETSAYEALSDDCESCEHLIEIVQRTYARGGSIQSEGQVIERVKKHVSGDYRVWVTAGQTVHKETANSGVRTFPGGRSLYQIQLTRFMDGYAVANLVEIFE